MSGIGGGNNSMAMGGAGDMMGPPQAAMAGANQANNTAAALQTALATILGAGLNSTLQQAGTGGGMGALGGGMVSSAASGGGMGGTGLSSMAGGGSSGGLLGVGMDMGGGMGDRLGSGGLSDRRG